MISFKTYISCLAIACTWLSSQNIYHNDQQLESETDKLIKEHPELFQKRSCQNDPNIHIVQTKHHQTKNDKIFRAILVCNEHARQAFTAEVCLQVIKELAQNTFLRQNIDLKVMYNANPISRERAINGEYCLRTNQNGVDINRNFPYGFGMDPLKYQQLYPGSKPFSETYSQCLDTEADDSSKPDDTKQVINIYLGIHSGEFSIYLSKCGEQNLSTKEETLLFNLRQKHCSTCRFRETGMKGGYGSSFEDMKCRKKFKYSNVFEVYGGFHHTYEDCWAIFNPINQQSFCFYQHRATDMILTYFTEILQTQNSFT